MDMAEKYGDLALSLTPMYTILTHSLYRLHAFHERESIYLDFFQHFYGQV